MKARSYTQRIDGEWFEIEPCQKLKCCDCGLVHVVKFRRRKGRLFMQAFRDNRATGQTRRRNQFSVTALRRGKIAKAALYSHKPTEDATK